MKNKKNIAMAMAAVSSFGAVAPAFANEIAPLALENLKVDYRLATGEELVKKDGKVRVLEGRSSLYNDNFTPDDKSDDTFKNEFKDAKILVSKNTNDKDDTNDLYVLVKKSTDASDITMAKAKLDAMIAEIKDAKAEGATVKVGELTKASINATDKSFVDSEIKVTVTFKGQAPKEYIFNGVPGVEEEESVEVNPFAQLVGTVNVQVKDVEKLTDAEKEGYYNLNKFKFVAEQNRDKFDFVKVQDDNNNKDLVVKVYKKGAKQEDKNLKFTMTIENFGELEKELVLNMSETTDFNSHWAKKEIEEAMLKGFVDTAANYRPDGKITRAEFAKIACTVFGLKTDDDTIKNMREPFNDVSKNDWFYRYVVALYNEKVDKNTNNEESVIQGNGSELFNPNDEITRQEAAVIIAKLVKPITHDVKKNIGTNEKPVYVHQDVKTKFADDKDIATWADNSVKFLSEDGKEVIKGIKEGNKENFKPQNQITRAETLVMMNRAFAAK